MDIQKLFDGTREPLATKLEQVKSVVIPDTLRTLPLVWGLSGHAVEHNFKILHDTPAGCAKQLLAAWAALGLVSAVDYATARGEWKIIPEICISGSGATRDFILFFNRDLKKLRTIAIDGTERFAQVLLKILLWERYEAEPDFITLPAGNLSQMLEKADAALISGEKALEYQVYNEAHLDLGEEWYDMTGLPLVTNFWAGFEQEITETDIQILRQSLAKGMENTEEISKEYAADKELSWRLYRDYFLKSRSYHLGLQQKEGLTEFYRYAFYHGLIEHIPDLHFWGE